MKVTLDMENDPHARVPNPAVLYILGAMFRDRGIAESFIAHTKKEIDQLWPKEKSEKS